MTNQSPEAAQLSVNGWNPEFIDALYQQWSNDPNSVDPEWRTFFKGFDLGYRLPVENGEVTATNAVAPPGSVQVAHSSQGKVDALIYHYRDIGHFAADLDPLGTKRPFPEYLTLASFDLTEADLDRTFDPGVLPLPNPAPLRDIIKLLEETYCRHIGVEYMHIQDREKRRWLQYRMEPTRNCPEMPREQKMRILSDLIEADAFENFINTRYRGKKRFGLDGGESLIPILNEMIERGPDLGVVEFTMGMAHRGRLNVLANIMNKTYDQIFTEFEEAWVEDFLEGGGDVKYHRGYSSDHMTTAGKPIRLTLSPNPSHLEFVNSVVLGRARAKQRLGKDEKREKYVPILMHGDAAFPAQGIVAECFNMARLRGYTVGGAIHVIINNQIGFTTDQKDAFSGHYCTDVAKMIDAPIFHVNGDDPEACAFVAQLALEYRQQFKADVVIDMWCYRKYGHNEGDEPTFTQPVMYRKIQSHTPVLKQYAEKLVRESIITQKDADKLYKELKNKLDESQTRSKDQPVDPSIAAFRSQWANLTEDYTDEPVETGAPKKTLAKVCEALGRVPAGFNVHKKLEKLLQTRAEVVSKDAPVDWAMGELLAYGTLLDEGHPIRLTGQDVERGTFSHRHAVVFDAETGSPHTPLNTISDKQARFCVHNSPLTESACLGYEYGYSLSDPHMLVIWEAQFGDFVNGAQVIIDQFIASAEVKWERHTGLVMFLPHGYEGQGPEHSSARLERFLTLCARNNMQVIYPSTPAQHFHMLRQQIKRNFRKPLIVMTPKSLLRHPKAVSSVAELTTGGFQRVLDDPVATKPRDITRVVLCTGKVYYDLIAQRDAVKRDDVAIVRIEQLYPFPQEPIKSVLERYKSAKELVWVQEEPKNMGAWRHIDACFRESLEITLPYIGREANATPAVASTKMHAQEQEKILIAAIGLPSTSNGAASKAKSKSVSRAANAPV
ncbi:MAG TPA: 2-oxoglutarate dehydrogenase E1 component [Phycisphaerales bacterium]|nr:2-oxoglutarate dehydrogenase E1 component [Phycisphaerales bacterium]